MEELRECPFCGEEARRGYNGAMHIVVCKFCGVRKPGDGGFATSLDAEKAWNTRPDSWISVEERLPETCCSCFAWIISKEFGGHCVAAHYNSIRKHFGYVDSDVVVTHWMPLPEPPKGDEN